MKYIARLRYLLSALIFLSQTAAAAITDVAGTGEDFDRLGEAVAAGDFNCDGYDDLAAGTPLEDIHAVLNAGVINIIYGGTGSGGKLGTTNNFYFVAGGAAESNDQFGSVLATGDFDGDGCDDLVVGIPYKNVAGISDAGEVRVYYGDPSGIDIEPEIWNQNTAVVTDSAEANDYFGASLAVGDFNDDGWDDLAIGIPGENTYAGAVYMMPGQPFAGISTLVSEFYTQNSTGIESSSESDDWFGGALATGDFNGDGYDDLAIGSPREDQNEVRDAGGVHILFGSTGYLTGNGSQWWQQGVGGILDANGDNNKFGYSLAAGDFDGDGYADLAIGVPNEGYLSGNPSFAYGAVNVVYGTTAGLSADGDQFWRADNSLIGVNNNGDFGAALAAGDFNNDGKDDLAIGAPGDYLNSLTSAGSVQMLYGVSGIGFNGLSAHHINQNTASVEGVSEWYEDFGYALATGDFNNDGKDDLAVGVPGDIDAGIEKGGVQVFYGTMGVLDWVSDQLFAQ